MIAAMKKFLGIGTAPTVSAAPYKIEAPIQPAPAPVVTDMADPVVLPKPAPVAKPATKRTKKTANPATE
jgi:hypothetical protein